MAEMNHSGLHSAVGRLEDIRTRQWSFAQEISHNWRGWLGSSVFHAAVIVLLVSITWPILVEKPDDVIIGAADMQPVQPLNQEPLESLFTPAPFEMPEEGPPSLTSGGEKPSLTEGGFDDQIGSDWIAHGRIPGWGPGGLPGIGPYGKRLRQVIEKDYRKLDVVFVFDSTGSMGGIILEVKTRIRQFMKVVTYLVPNTQVGLVTYRDKKKYDSEDYEYTAKYIPLTSPGPEGMEKLHRFLRETEAYGGGDIPEAVYDGVLAAIKNANWRPDSKKVILVFGDAPPRPENGELTRLYDLCADWHKKTGGIVSCIDTTGHSKLLEEFKDLATSGGGESCFLNDQRGIIKQLVVYIFPKEVAPDVEEVFNWLTQDDKDTVMEK